MFEADTVTNVDHFLPETFHLWTQKGYITYVVGVKPRL